MNLDETYRLNRKNQFDGNLKYGAKKFHSDTRRILETFPEEYSSIIQDTGENRYKLKAKFWEKVSECVVCSSKKFHHFMNRFGMDYYRCEKCSHKFLSPRIEEEKIGGLYKNEESMTNVYAQKLQTEVDKIKFIYGLDLIDYFLNSDKNNILDIGCGAGHFVNTASDYGWKTAIGLDINDSFSNLPYKSTGVQFINTEFKNFSLKKLNMKIDSITMWDVLEHVYNPVMMVKEIHNALSSQGIFLIMVPNSESLASRIIREKSPSFSWQHVSSFSSKSLKYLLSNNGFECLFLETVISEIDNIKSYLSGENPYGGYCDPDNLFDFITPEYIHKNLLGSRLLGIFKKIN